MHKYITQYTAYNLWANERIAAVLKKIAVELLDADVKSSFPSLRKTVHHIWDAEMIWLSRLEGKKMNWPPTAELKDPAIDDLLKTSQEFHNFVEAKGEEFLHSDTSFNDSKGNPFTMNNTGIIMHVVNHSSYHRGQIVTILRELGHTEIPSTDLIRYLREKK